MKEYFMHPVFDLTVRNRYIRIWWTEFKKMKRLRKHSEMRFAYNKWSELINRKWGYSPKGV